MKLAEVEVILTGAAGSLGLGVADILRDALSKLVLVDRVKRSEWLEKDDYFYQTDLADYAATARLMNQVFKDHPEVCVLINNAGIIKNSPMLNLLSKSSPVHDFELWDSTIKANLYTCFNASSHFVHHLIKRRKKGVIVNISSISATGNAGQTAYSAAKAGVEAMTRVWAKELGGFGIRSVCIAPGFFKTESTHNALNDQQIKHIKGNTPLRKLGQVDDLANALQFAIENEFLNGETIKLNGGLVI